ncbi:hypothetical protein BN130_3762 [Cronobacter malonaticus 507]|nr:hypothetical protein BN130_3762 [Cronobacter malonaticus 507]
MRAALRGRVAVGGNVVDLLLPFFHAGDIICKRHGLRGGIGMRGGETQQFSDRFLVGAVLRRAFFQHQAELFPEGLVFFSVIFSQFIQHLQHAFSQRTAQVAGDGAVLKDLARYVERQIVGVNQAAHKAQVVRHKLFGVVHDKHALHVEFQPVFMIAVPHIPRCLGRDVQQAGVLLLPFHAIMAPGQRIGEVVRDVLVELFIFVVADLAFAAGPQRLRLVDFLPRNDGFAVFLLAGFNLNRQRDMVGVFADDRAHAPVV